MPDKESSDNYIRKIERENSELREKLQLANNALIDNYNLPLRGAIAVGIAHNLNSPLGGIIGYSQLLQLKSPKIDGFDKVIKQAKRVSALLQVIARKGESETNSETSKLNLNAMLRSEIEFLHFDLFFKHQVERKVRLGEIPRFPARYNDFAQCFHFLLSNACHAVFNSSVKEISIITVMEEGHLLLKIVDTGEGIAPENIGKIFDFGFTTKPRPSEVEEFSEPCGFGLGLSIARTIMEPYNAELRIESEPGVGTTAIVDIPPETLAKSIEG